MGITAHKTNELPACFQEQAEEIFEKEFGDLELNKARSCAHWALIAGHLVEKHTNLRAFLVAGSAAWVVREDYDSVPEDQPNRAEYVFDESMGRSLFDALSNVGVLPEIHCWVIAVAPDGDVFNVDLTSGRLPESFPFLDWSENHNPSVVFQELTNGVPKPHEPEYRPSKKATSLMLRMYYRMIKDDGVPEYLLTKDMSKCFERNL